MDVKDYQRAFDYVADHLNDDGLDPLEFELVSFYTPEGDDRDVFHLNVVAPDVVADNVMDSSFAFKFTRSVKEALYRLCNYEKTGYPIINLTRKDEVRDMEDYQPVKVYDGECDKEYGTKDKEIDKCGTCECCDKKDGNSDIVPVSILGKWIKEFYPTGLKVEQYDDMVFIAKIMRQLKLVVEGENEAFDNIAVLANGFRELVDN